MFFVFVECDCFCVDLFIELLVVLLLFFKNLVFLNLFFWFFRCFLWQCVSVLMKFCFVCCLIFFIFLRNVLFGGMLVFVEYWKDFGQVFLFMCFLSFLMEFLDFLMLVFKEVMFMYFCFLFGFWFLVDVLGWLFFCLLWWQVLCFGFICDVGGFFLFVEFFNLYLLLYSKLSLFLGGIFFGVLGMLMLLFILLYFVDGERYFCRMLFVIINGV